MNKTLCCILNFYFLAHQIREIHRQNLEDMFEEINAHPHYFKDADFYQRRRVNNMFEKMNERPDFFKDVAHYEQERITNMLKEISTTHKKMENMFEEMKQFNHYLNLN